MVGFVKSLQGSHSRFCENNDDACFWTFYEFVKIVGAKRPLASRTDGSERNPTLIRFWAGMIEKSALPYLKRLKANGILTAFSLFLYFPTGIAAAKPGIPLSAGQPSTRNP